MLRISKILVVRFTLSLFIGYAVVLGLLLLVEDQLVFRPDKAESRWLIPNSNCYFHSVDLRLTDGQKIHARWFPCKNAETAVLMCHPTNANLSIHLSEAEVWKWHDKIESSVLIFDYPGYGTSDGRPTERGCYEAADAAYCWLVKSKQVAPEDILIMGRSLGTAVAVDLASRRPHRALILVAPFTSLPDVAASTFFLWPASCLMRNRFDSLEKIPQCRYPKLIFHGTDDRRVPIALGARLYNAAAQPKRFVRVEGARHNDTVMANFFPELATFLRQTRTDD